MKATKYLFFLLFLLFGVLAFAADWNCKINLPPNPQNYPKELLLRMMYVNITNSEHRAVTVYLHGEVRRDGKLIGKGNSNKIEISPGGKRITRSDITKIEKEWWDKEFEKLLFRLSNLPEGNYEACIFVYKAEGKKLLTKCCSGFESKPISPPRLISPKDGATLKEKYPLFRWTTPAPAPKEITYTLRIVEVRKGQTKEEAMRTNPAWFEQGGIKTTYLRYPVSARSFEEGKTYVWWTTAELERYSIATSEIFTFLFPTERPIIEEECDSLRREYEKLSRQIEEKKKECDCDSLKRELEEFEAELANAEKELEDSKQKKTTLEKELESAEKEFKNLFQKIQRCLGGSVWLYEYKDTDDLKKEAGKWALGRGGSYIGWGRKGIPGGIGVIGDVQFVHDAFERCRRKYGRHKLSEDFKKLHDLRAKKKYLKDKIKEAEDEIKENHKRVEELKARIAKLKTALGDCIKACEEEIKRMEQKRNSLVELHKKCLEKLDEQRIKKAKEKKALEWIDTAKEKIKIGEKEVKNAEDEISKAQDEINKHVDIGDEQRKLDNTKDEQEEAKKELEEAKKKLKEAEKAYRDGNPEKAEKLAKEARQKAVNAVKRSVNAKKRAIKIRSSAVKKAVRCKEGEKRNKKVSDSKKFIWEDITGIVKVPALMGGQPGKYSKKQIEDHLRRKGRYEQAKVFIGWIQLIKGGLEVTGTAVAKGLKLAAIELGKEVIVETIIPFDMINTIFAIWDDIMDQRGWEVYIKVKGRMWKINTWEECINGKWKRKLEAKPDGKSETQYLYLGIIQKHKKREQMKKQLQDLLKRYLPGMINKGSLLPRKVIIK